MLSHRKEVAAHLRAASEFLTLAHRSAGEQEGDQADLTGTTRDLIFGLNTAVEALAESIENAADIGGPDA